MYEQEKMHSASESGQQDVNNDDVDESDGSDNTGDAGDNDDDDRGNNNGDADDDSSDDNGSDDDDGRQLSIRADSSIRYRHTTLSVRRRMVRGTPFDRGEFREKPAD